MPNTDYYETLGVAKQATQEEIKTAYRKLASQLHPDNKETGDEEKFKRVNEAYQVLGNSEKRERYDRFPGLGEEQERFVRVVVNQQDDRPVVHGVVHVSLKEAVTGIENKQVDVEIKLPCDGCKGTGTDETKPSVSCSFCSEQGIIEMPTFFGKVKTICPACSGKGKQFLRCKKCGGRKTSGETMGGRTTVSIPPLTTNGAILTASFNEHKVNVGVQITLQESLGVDEEGNLFKQHFLQFPDLVLGTTEDMLLPDETSIKVKFSPGLNPGQMMRFQGKGLPTGHGTTRTDFILVVGLSIPTKDKLTKEQIKLLKKLQETNKQNT